MTPRVGPPRLTQSVTTPASLRRAIKNAARFQPTPEELQRMASSLSSLRIEMTPPEPAEMEADLHSGLRPVHPAMTMFMAKRPRRRMLIAARAVAAILAASFSVTWASVRLWRSSFAVHAPIVHRQAAGQLVPASHPASVAGPLPDVAPQAVIAPESPPTEVVPGPSRPSRSAPIRRASRVSTRSESVAAAPQAVPEVVPPVEPQAPPPAPKVSPEVQLLLEARKELRSDPVQALRWVREHERRFPNGALSQEREVIAIEALQRLGRKEEAKARIAGFRERYPSSIHGRRVDNQVTSPASEGGLERELSGSN